MSEQQEKKLVVSKKNLPQEYTKQQLMRMTPTSRAISGARNSSNTDNIAQALTKIFATVISIKEKNIDEEQIKNIVR